MNTQAISSKEEFLQNLRLLKKVGCCPVPVHVSHDHTYSKKRKDPPLQDDEPFSRSKFLTTEVLKRKPGTSSVAITRQTQVRTEDVEEFKRLNFNPLFVYPVPEAPKSCAQEDLLRDIFPHSDQYKYYSSQSLDVETNTELNSASTEERISRSSNFPINEKKSPLKFTKALLKSPPKRGRPVLLCKIPMSGKIREKVQSRKLWRNFLGTILRRPRTCSCLGCRTKYCDMCSKCVGGRPWACHEKVRTCFGKKSTVENVKDESFPKNDPVGLKEMELQSLKQSSMENVRERGFDVKEANSRPDLLLFPIPELPKKILDRSRRSLVSLELVKGWEDMKRSGEISTHYKPVPSYAGKKPEIHVENPEVLESPIDKACLPVVYVSNAKAPVEDSFKSNGMGNEESKSLIGVKKSSRPGSKRKRENSSSGYESHTTSGSLSPLCY